MTIILENTISRKMRFVQSRQYQCAPCLEEVKSKIDKTLASAMDRDTAITGKSFDISEHFSFLADVHKIGRILAHLSNDLSILNRYFVNNSSHVRPIVLNFQKGQSNKESRQVYL